MGLPDTFVGCREDELVQAKDSEVKLQEVLNVHMPQSCCPCPCSVPVPAPVYGAPVHAPVMCSVPVPVHVAPVHAPVMCSVPVPVHVAPVHAPVMLLLSPCPHHPGPIVDVPNDHTMDLQQIRERAVAAGVFLRVCFPFLTWVAPREGIIGRAEGSVAPIF
eukprot:1141844-Pelagomonas_calceolata.AAC.6